MPTDTTYGISADATNKKVAKKIQQIKMRETAKPLSILVSDKEMLQKYVEFITPLENQMIDKFTPGKLSILFKKNDLVDNSITANSEFVSIRIPDNEMIRAFIKKFGKPIISTSANITGKEIISEVDELEENIKNNVDYIWNIGKLPTIPSTIIKVENEKIKFLRNGELTNQIKESFKNYIEED